MVSVGKVHLAPQVVAARPALPDRIDGGLVDRAHRSLDDRVVIGAWPDQAGEGLFLPGLDVDEEDVGGAGGEGVDEGRVEVLFHQRDGENDGQRGGEGDYDGKRGVVRTKEPLECLAQREVLGLPAPQKVQGEAREQVGDQDQADQRKHEIEPRLEVAQPDQHHE